MNTPAITAAEKAKDKFFKVVEENKKLKEEIKKLKEEIKLKDEIIKLHELA